MFSTLAYLIRSFNNYTFSDDSWTQAEKDVQLGLCLLCLNIQKGKCWCGTEAQVFKVCTSCSDLSVEHAGLIGGHHVFDIDEGVLSPVALKHLQSLLDQVAHVLPPVLAVVDAVSGVNWGREQVGCRQPSVTQTGVIPQPTAGKWHLPVGFQKTRRRTGWIYFRPLMGWGGSGDRGVFNCCG